MVTSHVPASSSSEKSLHVAYFANESHPGFAFSTPRPASISRAPLDGEEDAENPENKRKKKGGMDHSKPWDYDETRTCWRIGSYWIILTHTDYILLYMYSHIILGL